MATTVLCRQCGEQVVRAPGPDARCPKCQSALPPPPPLARSTPPTPPTVRPAAPPVKPVQPVEPTGAARWAQTEIPATHFPVPAGGYEDLELGPEPDEPRPAPAAAARPSKPGIPAATPATPRPASPPTPARGLPSTEVEPLRRPPPSQSAITASRMASAPTFSSTRKKDGLPIIPLAIGVVAVIAITVFALTRGGPAPAPAAAPARPAPVEPRAGETVRTAEPTAAAQPPAPIEPAAAKAEAPAPPVAEPPPPKEKRAEREAARPAKPERTAPAREQGRKEPQVAAAARPAAAPAPAPAPAAPPPPAPEPQAPLFTPAQQEQTPTAAPLQLGPTYAREGMRKARMADPACLGSNLRLPPDVSLDGESATVKFAVDEKGAVSRYEYLAGPSDARVSKAIWNAIQRCEFVPGASAQGQPIQLWVTMPVRFGK